MKDLFAILFLTYGICACTFEDVLDHTTENPKEQGDDTSLKGKYDFVITPQNVSGDFKTFFQGIVNRYSNVLIKDGTYEIVLTSSDGVKPKDGCTITFEKNAKIKVKPNNLSFYSVIDLRGRKDITIKNPNLEGDKYNHLGTSGQWGHGINIVECKNITIHDAYATKFWGDGIYLRDCQNIRIYNAHLPDNRRQGMSITSGHDIEIHNLIAENTGGQEPGYGIDIEPNWNRDHITKLRIYKPVLRNNGKGKSSYTAGLCFTTQMSHILNYPYDKKLTDAHYDIEIFDPVFEGDALLISIPTDYAKGTIKIHNPTFYRSKNSAIYISNHQSDFFKTEIINPKFVDCVATPENEHAVYLAPIVMTCFKHLSHKNIGNRNITITNPTIEASNNAKYSAVAIRNSTPNSFKEDLKNVTITNATTKGYKIPFYNHTGDPKTMSNLHHSFSMTFSDKGGYPSQPLAYGNTVSKAFDGGVINYTSDKTNSTIYINDDILISNFEFFYTNNSKDKSPLTLLFGTKKQPAKAYINKIDPSRRINGIEIPFGSYIKMKKTFRDKDGIQHWEVTKASSNVKGINTAS